MSDEGAPLFRELTGDYVEGTGQTLSLGEYLDYFEPLGSALSRLPDGVGGPFVHQFTGGQSRVIGAVGWVVSAAAKRYGGWTLWGMWTDRPVPPFTLPLFWSDLADPKRLPDVIRRANAAAERLIRRDAALQLLDDLNTKPLHDDRFRNDLKIQLSRLYDAPPGTRSMEVEIGRARLDLLPWLYLLGPLEPTTAQLQPSRVSGAGYQYILAESPPPSAAEVRPDVEEMVDTTADDALEGWRLAVALRERRTPRPKVAPPPEVHEMPTKTTPTRPTPRRAPQLGWQRMQPMLPMLWRTLCDLVIIALLAWIALGIRDIQKTLSTPTVTRTTPPPVTATQPLAPMPTPTQVIAEALATRPPQGMTIDRATLNAIAHDATTAANARLAHVAIEIFLRQNGCHPRAETVDGKFSPAEQRAIRRCPPLAEQHLMKSASEPDTNAAIDWLAKTMGMW